MRLIKNKKIDGLLIEDHIMEAHAFLLHFLSKYDDAKRGGIHDFMEITLFNMINSAVKKIDDYLQDGHKNVDAKEIMHIVIDAYQKVLDSIKKNLDAAGKVHME